MPDDVYEPQIDRAAVGGATLRGRTISGERNGRRFFVRLLPNCDLVIRERFARRGVTLTANELLTKHDQLKNGSLFPEALL